MVSISTMQGNFLLQVFCIYVICIKYIHRPVCIYLTDIFVILYSFFWRCEVGTDNWVQCNDAPVKICKYPVTGLFEGRSYIFRVRAVNSAGISRPSRVSEAVAALDPVDLKRLRGRLCRCQAPAVPWKLGAISVICSFRPCSAAYES